MFEIKAPFKRKDTEIQTTDCVVDKVIHLSGAQFDSFSRGLLRDWDFIRDNPIDTIVDAEGRYHCLLVLGEGRRDGILVNAEGGSYAQYSAFLSGARDMLIMDKYPSFTGLVKTLDAAADHVVSQASAEWPEGVRVDDPSKYAVSFRQLNDVFGLSFGDGSYLTEVFAAMLHDRPEIERVRFNTEEFLIDASVREEALESDREDTAAPVDVDKEFAAWKNLCDGIPGNWKEDRRYRQKKDGALYYLGGENGQYMRVTNDGKLTVGKYELARSGIEDAVLFARVTQQYASYEQAFLIASRLAGQRFEHDIFQEKPSVMEQIREARKNPAPPSPKKEPGKGTPEPEI